MTDIEVERLEDLLYPPVPVGLSWYRATLRQGWKRQLRRVFGAVEAPIERLVRVRIGPVRIDGLKSGKVRPLKAPEVRGLGGGGGRSRGDNRIEDVVEVLPESTARPRVRPSPRRDTSRPGGPTRPPRSIRPARPRPPEIVDGD
jgi:hypothetical protein